MINSYQAFRDNIGKTKPIIQHITNYVTINDCANVTLAIGASPIMADAIEEAEDIANISSALVINMGALNQLTIPAMLLAGQTANKVGIPVVFDPVGAGASKLRNDTVFELISKVHMSVIRGNISEIRFIAGLSSDTKGVDASESDATSAEATADIAQSLAQKLNSVIVISGKTDTVSDGKKTVYIDNGHAMLSSLTGTGCMSTSLIACFAGANKDNIFSATVMGQMTMGIAGEIAYENAGHLGTGSFRAALHDAVYQMNGEIVEKMGKVYEL